MRRSKLAHGRSPQGLVCYRKKTGHDNYKAQIFLGASTSFFMCVVNMVVIRRKKSKKVSMKNALSSIVGPTSY